MWVYIALTLIREGCSQVSINTIAPKQYGVKRIMQANTLRLCGLRVANCWQVKKYRGVFAKVNDNRRAIL